MDLSKKAVLIQWLNKLNPNLVIESLSDLREGEQFIALLNKIKDTSYDVNTKKERFEIVQKFIEDKYDDRLVEQVNFDEDNELNLAKIAVLVLAAGVEGRPQEEFMKAALSLNVQSQLEIMSILKQALNLPLYNIHLDNLFTHKQLEIFDSEKDERSEISSHDTSWSSDSSANHTNYDITKKNKLLKKLDHELEYERHHSFELECNLKENKNIISSKDDKIRELNNQIRDLKKLHDQLDDYHNLKEEYVKLEATATKVKSQSDELKSLKSENALLIDENAKVYEEVNKMKEMISEKQCTIEKLTEDLEAFNAKESNWQQTEARYKSELQKQEMTPSMDIELSNVRNELELILKNLERNIETQDKMFGSEISSLKQKAKSYIQLKSEKEKNYMKQQKHQEMLPDHENSLLEKQKLAHQLECEQKFCGNLKEEIKVKFEDNQSLMKELKQLQNFHNDLQKQHDMLNKCIKTHDQLILKKNKCTEFEKKLTKKAVEKLTKEKQYVNDLEQTQQTLFQDLKENIEDLEKQNEEIKIKADQDFNEIKRNFSCVNGQVKEKQIKTEKEYIQVTKNRLVKTSKQKVLKIQNTYKKIVTKSKSLGKKKKDIQEEMKEKQVKVEKEYNEMRKELTQHLREKDEELKNSKEQILKRQNNYRQELTKSKSLEEEIKVLKLKQNNRIDSLKRSFQSRIIQLKSDHEMVLNRIKTDYNNYMRKVNEMSKIAYADHKNIMIQLTKYMTENDEELKTSKQEIVKIQSAYEEKIIKCESLEKEIEMLKDCHSQELATSQYQYEEVQQVLCETISNCEKILSDKKTLVVQFENEQMSERKIHKEEISKLNRIIKEVRNECQQWKKANTDHTKLEIATSQELGVLKKKHKNLCSKIESLKEELKTAKEDREVVTGKLQDYEIFNLIFTAICCSFSVVPLLG